MWRHGLPTYKNGVAPSLFLETPLQKKPCMDLSKLFITFQDARKFGDNRLGCHREPR